MDRSPENLALTLQNLLTSDTVQELRTTIDGEDNEQITQILLSTFRCFMNLMGSVFQDDDTLLFQGINLALIQMGYMIHRRDIPRTELSSIVYYSRITPAMEMLRSQFHPLHLMSLMPPDEVPSSFKALLMDSDYLANIISVWDQGDADNVTLLTFQKVNVHYGAAPPAQSDMNDLD